MFYGDNTIMLLFCFGEGSCQKSAKTKLHIKRKLYGSPFLKKKKQQHLNGYLCELICTDLYFSNRNGSSILWELSEKHNLKLATVWVIITEEETKSGHPATKLMT